MSTISPEDGGAEAVGELSKKSGGIDVVTEARGPNPRDETDARNEKGIPKVKSLQAINRCPSDKLAGTKSTGVSRGVVINVQPR